MKNVFLQARNFTAYWKAFGFRGACDVVRGWRQPETLFSIRVASCGRPLWIRRGTTDFAVLKQAVEFRRDFVPAGFVPRSVLDLGANVGITPSIFAARWPKAKVVAVEPEQRNFDLLQINCSPAANIAAVQGAVWIRDGELEIINPDDEAFSFQVGESNTTAPQAVKVPGFSIPTLMKMHALDTLDVVKMDIEGAEKEIFENGASEWLPFVRVLIVELHDRFRPGCKEALLSAVGNRPHQHHMHGEYDVFHFES